MGSNVPSRTRRGNAAVTALTLTGLLGFGALAVDIAWVRVIDAQVEAAIDAGALAGAGFLDGTPEGVTLAVEKAVEFANLNPISIPYEITAQDVQTGHYDPETGEFTPMGAEAPELVDMVQITAKVEGIQAILAGAAFGTESLSTSGTTRAYRPLVTIASEVECFLPLALPTCLFPQDPTTNPPPIDVTMGDSTVDSVGWALPNGVNASDLNSQLVNGCGGETIEVGDTMDVQNGVVSSAVNTVGKILNGRQGAAEPWPTDWLGSPYDRNDPALAYPIDDSLVQDNNWGNVLQGPIALIDLGGEPGTCAGAANFNGVQEVKGFTWGVLYDARGGQDAGFMLQLDFLNEHELGTDSSTDAIGNVTAPPGPPYLVN